MWVAPTCSSPHLLNNFWYWCQGGGPQLAVGFPEVLCHPLRKASSPSLLLRATGRNQPVVAGKKCSMILLQAVVSLTFSLLRGVRLCCSELEVLCSLSGSTSVHLEVRLGPAEPCEVSWGEREGKQAPFWNVGWNGKAVSGVTDVQQKALFVKASLKTQLLIPGFGLPSETPRIWNLHAKSGKQQLFWHVNVAAG